MSDLFEDVMPEVKARKHLVLEDRKKIHKMVNAGLSHAFIAEMMGVHFTTISKELRRCEKGKYDPEKAQKIVDANNQKRFTKHPGADLEERIEALEMQVQILCEKIEELNAQ